MNSIINQIIYNQVRELKKKREAQILNRLSELGYTFSNEIEKQEFAQNRLTMHTFEDKPKWRELYLDNNQLIASWWENVELSFDPLSNKCIATFGVKP